MKRSALKLTLAFMLAVCTLTGCGKDSSEPKNDNRNNSSSAAVTTVSEETGSISAAAATAADKTEAETTRTETALPDNTEAPQSDETDVTSADQSESISEAVTEAQALEAVKNYCFTKNPDLKNMVDSGEYNIYWNASVNDANEIVVLFRSYTAAQIRYYIDPNSGETYVTELVPGIIDEEQRTEESFNIRDYLG